ncbi:hypothetical protein [Deinococcus sp. QL22]|uniref:hypothetical protein n=1 Tax=Deinococcus sp. QL22 TaxID=2939437 RepID=UPI0020182CD6|nr:hypothetical protein [Deinococcus sp. QL22]UQN09077.1 hypothetical protein M1R55_23805 [Deinococcus sp. QL22]
MYPVRRTDFPTGQTVEVPAYRINAFDGTQLELTPDSRQIQVDLTVISPASVANARRVQRDGSEIRGLIALDAVPFARALEQAVAQGNSRRFGTVLKEKWYLLAPIELEFSPQAGEQVVVGVYR